MTLEMSCVLYERGEGLFALQDSSSRCAVCVILKKTINIILHFYCYHSQFLEQVFFKSENLSFRLYVLWLKFVIGLNIFKPV